MRPPLIAMLTILGFMGVVTFLAVMQQKELKQRNPIRYTEYKNGDTLYPDYAIMDTLIVIDADNMNKFMKYASTDDEIATIAYACTRGIIEWPPMRDYQIELDMDTLSIYKGFRLVYRKVSDHPENSIDSALLKDNQ